MKYYNNMFEKSRLKLSKDLTNEEIENELFIFTKNYGEFKNFPQKIFVRVMKCMDLIEKRKTQEQQVEELKPEIEDDVDSMLEEITKFHVIKRIQNLTEKFREEGKSGNFGSQTQKNKMKGSIIIKKT